MAVRRIVGIVWDVLLAGVFVVAMSWVVPKVIDAFAGDIDLEAVRVGVADSALGLLIAFALATLASWTWSPIGRRARVAVALIAVGFVAAGAVNGLLDRGSSVGDRWRDLWRLAVTVAVLAGPIVVVGRGWIGVPVLLVERLRASASDAPG